MPVSSRVVPAILGGSYLPHHRRLHAPHRDEMLGDRVEFAPGIVHHAREQRAVSAASGSGAPAGRARVGERALCSGAPSPEVRPVPSRVRLVPARDTAFMSLTLTLR